jgi:hypothetical protein
MESTDFHSGRAQLWRAHAAVPRGSRMTVVSYIDRPIPDPSEEQMAARMRRAEALRVWHTTPSINEPLTAPRLAAQSSPELHGPVPPWAGQILRHMELLRRSAQA